MSPTTPTKVVRALAGKGPWLYNDRRKDGSRSIKVQNWDKRAYDKARKALEQAGFKAEVRKNYQFNLYFSDYNHSRYRLRVWA